MNAVGTTIRGTTIGVFEPSRERLDQLGAWFATEYPSLLRFAYFVTGESAAAEDLVQDAFVRMYRAGARVEDAGVKTYARTTIVNLSRSGFRRRARAPEVQNAPEAPRAAEGPDLAARDEMWRALQTLSPRQRAVVALRFYEDMSERDIASTLGMSVGSVKKHTDRALARLRDLLGRES